MILKTRLNVWLLIATIITALFISGCKKDEKEDPKIDPAPTLTVTVLYNTVNGTQESRNLPANGRVVIAPGTNLFSLRMQVDKAISWKLTPSTSTTSYKEVAFEQGDNTTQIIATAGISILKGYYKGNEFFSGVIEISNFDENVQKGALQSVTLRYTTTTGEERTQPFANGNTITISPKFNQFFIDVSSRKELGLYFRIPGRNIDDLFSLGTPQASQLIVSKPGITKLTIKDGATIIWQGNIVIEDETTDKEIPVSILKIWNYDDQEPSANITVTNGGTVKIRKRSDQFYRYKLRLKTEIPVSLAVVKNGQKGVVRENIVEFSDNFFTVDLPKEELHIEVTITGYKSYVVTLLQE